LTELKKYIVFLLFGIFFFPILFQSIHIVWHHSHGHDGKHHVFNHETSDKGFHANRENISEEEETCPICEYQFSINDLPAISIFSLEIPVYPCIYNKIITRQQYKQVFSDKTPRAPPVLTS